MNAEVQRATAIYFCASKSLQHHEQPKATHLDRPETTHYDPRATDVERMSEGIHEMIHEEAISEEEAGALIDSATDENGHINKDVVKEIMDELSA